MSHEITQRRNGKAEIAFVGEKPWHGLGQELTAGASIEEWRVAAGMDWKILRSRVRFPLVANPTSLDQFGTMEDKHVLLRSDSKDALAVVSDKYKIVQPAEVLEFFRDLVADSGFTLNTAGTLFGGRRFWALARVEEDAKILNPKDKVGGFLLLSTSCDGSMKTEARMTTVRVVCNNTLTMARGERAQVKISHRTKFNAASVKDQLGIIHGAFAEFLKETRALAARKITAAESEVLFERTLGGDEPQPEVRDSDAFKKILSLFNGAGRGAKLEGVAGTAWGAVNAVTEYADHHRRASSIDHRFFNSQWGAGESMKERAMEEALRLV